MNVTYTKSSYLLFTHSSRNIILWFGFWFLMVECQQAFRRKSNQTWTTNLYIYVMALQISVEQPNKIKRRMKKKRTMWMWREWNQKKKNNTRTKRHWIWHMVVSRATSSILLLLSIYIGWWPNYSLMAWKISTT